MSDELRHPHGTCEHGRVPDFCDKPECVSQQLAKPAPAEPDHKALGYHSKSEMRRMEHMKKAAPNFDASAPHIEKAAESRCEPADDFVPLEELGCFLPGTEMVPKSALDRERARADKLETRLQNLQGFGATDSAIERDELRAEVETLKAECEKWKEEYFNVCKFANDYETQLEAAKKELQRALYDSLAVFAKERDAKLEALARAHSLEEQLKVMRSFAEKMAKARFSYGDAMELASEAIAACDRLKARGDQE
jgi:vacuolar-type H+-ATPase subunit I/STV1